MTTKAAASAKMFRDLALSFDAASEGSHMSHADFRANGRIFATLGYPDEEWGMVKVTPAAQAVLIKNHPDLFKRCNGAWGRSGSTNVRLVGVSKVTLRKVLRIAWDAAMLSGRKVRRRTG